MPKISVIIPCYNLGKYIEEAVESVLNQEEQDFEIIIVNDGSTDDYTNQLLLNYKKNKTTVYNLKNQGVSLARNFGISKSKGEYIVCLDSDDILHPKYLSSCLQVFINDVDKKIGIVSTWLQSFGEQTFLWKTEDYKPIKLLFNTIVHTASMFRKEAWEEAKGYKDNMKEGYEDWEFWVNIVSKGWEWFTIKKPYFYYRVLKISMSTSANKVRNQLIELVVSNNYDYYAKNIAAMVINYDLMAKQFENTILKYKRQTKLKTLLIAGMLLIIFLLIINLVIIGSLSLF